MIEPRATVVVCPCKSQIRLLTPCPDNAPWFRCPVCGDRVRAVEWRPAPVPSRFIERRSQWSS
jgi:hypothetical protein